MGFPPGGEARCVFADLTGLDKVLASIEGFHREFGARWQPAPLLQKLVAEGRTFRDFDRQRQV